MVRSHEQQVALALGPKFSGSLSLIGSSWIIFEVLRDGKKQALVYHRLLFAISLLDVIISSAWFLSTWPVPKEVEGLYGNMGNERTCNAQGFFIQLKAGNPFYNTFLALYFVLVVKFGWTETTIRSIEPFMHIISIGMAVGTSTASWALGLFGNANLWCWIEGKYPMYRLYFFYIWYWASLIAVTLSMGIVYWTVRSQENASRKYSTHKGKKTHKVATQAILYIAAYYVTALFSTIVRTMQAVSDGVPFWAILGMTIFYPAQGFMNFLIYVRPRYLRYRQKHPDWSLAKTIKVSLKRAFRGSAVATDSDDELDVEDDDYKLGTPLEDAPSGSPSSAFTVSSADSNICFSVQEGEMAGEEQEVDLDSCR